MILIDPRVENWLMMQSLCAYIGSVCGWYLFDGSHYWSKNYGWQETSQCSTANVDIQSGVSDIISVHVLPGQLILSWL